MVQFMVRKILSGDSVLLLLRAGLYGFSGLAGVARGAGGL